MNFDFLKVSARGMLNVSDYELLSQLSEDSGPGNKLEIAAGRGASTSAIAWPLVKNSWDGRVFTIEKCKGGSWGNDSFKDNKDQLHKTWEQLGVIGKITLFPGERSEVANDVLEHRPFNFVFLDADGAIDLDFHYFYDAILPGSPIVIDDYSNRNDKNKQGVTYKWVTHFVEIGLIEIDQIFDSNVWWEGKLWEKQIVVARKVQAK